MTTITGSRRTALVLLAAFTAFAIVAIAAASLISGFRPQSADSAPDDPVVAAAGDIACPNNHADYNGGNGTATACRQKHTAALLGNADHVFMLGDGQYSVGALSQYNAVYDATWGSKKSVTYPTPGDHEYQSGSAAGYFSYFGVDPYYSFDIASWHWVSLNSEIDHGATSAQAQWLRQDLASTTKPCIGAFWASPRFSSGHHGNYESLVPFWESLYAVGADIVLSGDDHDYERFAKQTPNGAAASNGIRQFVVGTGGRSLYEFETLRPNSEVRARVFGVLELRLGANDYGWQFRTESGGTFSDSGTTACNGAPVQPTGTVTPTPTNPTSTNPTPTAPTTTQPPTSAPLCYSQRATIVGTKNADTLVGTAGADVIAGLAGNDTIDGANGNDLICGAAGNDTSNGGGGNDRINGGAGADRLTDLAGVDVLDGAADNDTLNLADGATGDTANGGGNVDACRVSTGDKKSSCESAGGS